MKAMAQRTRPAARTRRFALPRRAGRGFLVGLAAALVLLAPGSAWAAASSAPSSPSINVPLVLETDKLWKTHQLGTCPGLRLGNAGCAVISTAMVYAKYGVAVSSSVGVGMNQDILNAWLHDNGGYTADPGGGVCDVIWGHLPPGVLHVGYDRSVAHLDAELAAGWPVIALVHTLKWPMHFVVITGRHGGTYDINDPYYIIRRQLDDGTPDAYIADAFHYFRPIPASAATTAYRATAAALWSQITSSLDANTAAITTTILPDGRILLLTYGVTNDGTSPLSSLVSEIYNPIGGTFTVTGSMLEAGMTSPTATVLPGGRVLFVGDGAPPEIYDPGSGTFAETGPMICPSCVGRTVVALSDGRVLLAGGYYPASENLAPNEIYNPADGQFTYAGTMLEGRTHAGTLLLPNGRVLFVGGLAAHSLGQDDELSGALPVEIYDPATFFFTSLGQLPVARIAPGLSLRPDGQVQISGGYDLAGQVVSESDLFDPADGSFSRLPANPPSIY